MRWSAVLVGLLAVAVYVSPVARWRFLQGTVGPLAWVGWQSGVLWPALLPKVDGWFTIRPCAAKVAKSKQWEPRDDDIVLSTFPRSGTHMVAVMILEVLARGDANFTDLMQTLHSVELPTKKNVFQQDSEDALDEHHRTLLGGRRLIVTHLNAEQLVLQASTRYVIVVRDPLDTICSMSHTVKMVLGLLAPKGASMVRHIAELANGWAEWYTTWSRKQDNVLVLHYTDVASDPSDAVDRVAKFLQVNLTAVEASNAADRSSLAFEKRHKRHGQAPPTLFSPPDKHASGDFHGISFNDALKPKDKTLTATCSGLGREEAKSLRAAILGRLAATNETVNELFKPRQGSKLLKDDAAAAAAAPL